MKGEPVTEKDSLALLSEKLGVIVHHRGFAGAMRAVLGSTYEDDGIPGQAQAAWQAEVEPLLQVLRPDGYFLRKDEAGWCLIAVEVENTNRLSVRKCQDYLELWGYCGPDVDFMLYVCDPYGEGEYVDLRELGIGIAIIEQMRQEEPEDDA